MSTIAREHSGFHDIFCARKALARTHTYSLYQFYCLNDPNKLYFKLFTSGSNAGMLETQTVF